MAVLRVVYFVLAVAVLIVAKVEMGFSDGVLVVLAVAALAIIVISYPVQMRMISSVAYRKRELGPQAMIGLEGRAIEKMSPHGRVRVRGEIWKARAVGGSLERGDEVVITGIGDGLTLMVEPLSRNRK